MDVEPESEVAWNRMLHSVYPDFTSGVDFPMAKLYTYLKSSFLPTILIELYFPNRVLLGFWFAHRGARIAHREARAPRFAVLDVCALGRGFRAMGGSIDDVASFRSLYRSTLNSSAAPSCEKSTISGVPPRVLP